MISDFKTAAEGDAFKQGRQVVTAEIFSLAAGRT
jgi:hypothetical protein